MANETGKVTVQSSAANGSGVIISDDGYVLTNEHVVKNLSPWASISVRTKEGWFDADLVSMRPKDDIALLKIRSKGTLPKFEAASYAPSSLRSRPTGKPPFEFQQDITHKGKSSIFKEKKMGFRVRAALGASAVGSSSPGHGKPGDSGGPLYDTEGNLVSIHSGGYKGEISIPIRMVSDWAERAISLHKKASGQHPSYYAQPLVNPKASFSEAALGEKEVAPPKFSPSKFFKKVLDGLW